MDREARLALLWCGKRWHRSPSPRCSQMVAEETVRWRSFTTETATAHCVLRGDDFRLWCMHKYTRKEADSEKGAYLFYQVPKG